MPVRVLVQAMLLMTVYSSVQLAVAESGGMEVANDVSTQSVSTICTPLYMR